MSATISGNVGGSSFSGVVVCLYGQASTGPVQTTATSDSSGNYSFTPAAGNYIVTALSTTVSSQKYNYLSAHNVSVQLSDVTNSTTFTVNFAPTAANAANAPTF
jgi:hypothetical protein